MQQMQYRSSSQGDELGLLINLIVFLFKRIFSVRYLWRYREEKDSLHSFYKNNFDYYNLLTKREKRKFLIRIISLRASNEIKISDEIKNKDNEVESHSDTTNTKLTALVVSESIRIPFIQNLLITR
jgi:hypothetical protein